MISRGISSVVYRSEKREAQEYSAILTAIFAGTAFAAIWSLFMTMTETLSIPTRKRKGNLLKRAGFHRIFQEKQLSAKRHTK